MFLLKSTISDIDLLVGRLHPLLVHLPIGILMILILFEFLAGKERFAVLKPAVVISSFWAMLFAILSCIAGYMLSQSGEYDEETLQLHKWMGIGLAVLTSLFFIAKKLGYTNKILSNIFLVSLTLFLAAAGHFGGVLTHGEEYLREPVLGILGIKSETRKERKPITNIQEAFVYTDLIEPVFEQKCNQCHNANKKKGGLRMDTPEMLWKGGKKGPVVVSGDISKSELFKRIKLPLDDKHRMPPKGKVQLTSEEIFLVQWWINSGASMDKKVNQLPIDKDVSATLAILHPNEEIFNDSGSAAKPEFPDVKLAPLNPKHLEAVKNLKLVAAQISPEHQWLSINAVNNPGIENEELKNLLLLKDDIAWLKLGNTKITDSIMKTIGQLRNLTRLNLEHTGITDAGLHYLKDLKHLQYLNLVGTGITDKGLVTLSNMKSLRNIYIWQTNTSETAVAALNKVLPTCDINIGDGKTLLSNKRN
jgi:uncharacterized membrane protein